MKFKIVDFCESVVRRVERENGYADTIEKLDGSRRPVQRLVEQPTVPTKSHSASRYHSLTNWSTKRNRPNKNRRQKLKANATATGGRGHTGLIDSGTNVTLAREDCPLQDERPITKDFLIWSASKDTIDPISKGELPLGTDEKGVIETPGMRADVPETILAVGDLANEGYVTILDLSLIHI